MWDNDGTRNLIRRERERERERETAEVTLCHVRTQDTQEVICTPNKEEGPDQKPNCPAP